MLMMICKPITPTHVNAASADFTAGPVIEACSVISLQMHNDYKKA